MSAFCPVIGISARDVLVTGRHRTERPHRGAQLFLFEAEDGGRYTLWVANLRGWC